MKNFYNTNHQEILKQFDEIKSVQMNPKLPQFVVIGLKNKRIMQVKCDFINNDLAQDVKNKVNCFIK